MSIFKTCHCSNGEHRRIVASHLAIQFLFFYNLRMCVCVCVIALRHCYLLFNYPLGGWRERKSVLFGTIKRSLLFSLIFSPSVHIAIHCNQRRRQEGECVCVCFLPPIFLLLPLVKKQKNTISKGQHVDSINIPMRNFQFVLSKQIGSCRLSGTT